MRNSNFTRRYYQPARCWRQGCVAGGQSVLVVSETRRGLAVLGDSTVAAVIDFHRSAGSEVRPVVGKDE